MEKSLTIQTKPENVSVEYVGDDIVKIHLHNNLSLCINFDNDVLLQSKGDFVISADGEIDLISKGSPICLDSIDSEIHLNSRHAKPIKNLPQSIEYRKKLIEEDSKFADITKEIEEKDLKKRVIFLENKLSALIKILEICEFK